MRPRDLPIVPATLDGPPRIVPASSWRSNGLEQRSRHAHAAYLPASACVAPISGREAYAACTTGYTTSVYGHAAQQDAKTRPRTPDIRGSQEACRAWFSLSKNGRNICTHSELLFQRSPRAHEGGPPPGGECRAGARRSGRRPRRDTRACRLMSAVWLARDDRAGLRCGAGAHALELLRRRVAGVEGGPLASVLFVERGLGVDLEELLGAP